MTVHIAGRDFPTDRFIRVRVRATGQVLSMIPAAAAALVNGGTAELAEDAAGKPERAVRDPRPETAVAPQQKPTPKVDRKKK